MKIKSLRLQHFRRFDDFELPLHENLTVLVARNGAGKSSVLDALAIGLGPFLTRLPKIQGLSPRDLDFQVFPDGSKPPFMRITCEANNGVSWDRTVRRDSSKKTSQLVPEARGLKQLNDYVDHFVNAFNEGNDFELPIFIHYGTARGVFEVPKRKRGFQKKFTRFDSFNQALESKTNFRSFVEYFYSLDARETALQKEKRSFEIEIPELKAIRHAVGKLMPEFSNPVPAYPAGIAVDWNQNGVKKKLRIEQLSDGYRTTLAMTMDIAARMAEANPEKDDPLLTTGVVMIDEVDLHLHPGWQQTILLDLTRTFPNVQFVVSTHSPQVVSSVSPESLRVIEWQDDKPSLMPVSFSQGAEAQQMLLDVLGVQSSRVEALEIVKNLHRFQELVDADQWDTKEAKELHQKLKLWGAGFEPELVRLEMDIRVKEWERSNG